VRFYRADRVGEKRGTTRPMAGRLYTLFCLYLHADLVTLP
jgi:hypothetical protein